MPKYQKPPLSHADQVELLKSHGLIIDDFKEAESILSHLNYYRLSAYWIIFKKDDGNFKENTHFNTILNHYLFDKDLRILILEAIETFEISFRANWAYILSTTTKDSHAYLNLDLIDKRKVDKYKATISEIEKSFEKSHEIFIKHYKEKYDIPKLPPIWSVCEIFSFGNLLSFYFCLIFRYQKIICKIYGIEDVEVFISFIRNINIVRNICAHHGRLWNRKITTSSIKFPNNPKFLKDSLNLSNESGIYNTIAFLIYISKTINQKNKWIDKFQTFIKKSIEENIVAQQDLHAMGFPQNWQNLDLWKKK